VRFSLVFSFSLSLEERRPFPKEEKGMGVLFLFQVRVPFLFLEGKFEGTVVLRHQESFFLSSEEVSCIGTASLL